MDDIPDDVLEAFVASSATLAGLVIEPAWRQSVLGNLRTIAQAAHLLADHPLGDEDEAAPVFTA